MGACVPALQLQAAQSCLETTRVQLEEAMAEAARFEAKYLEERMERRKVQFLRALKTFKTVSLLATIPVV